MEEIILVLADLLWDSGTLPLSARNGMASSRWERLRRLQEAIRRRAEKEEVDKAFDEGWLRLPAEYLEPLPLIRSAEVVEDR